MPYVVNVLTRLGALILAAGVVAVALLVADPNHHVVPEGTAVPLVATALIAVPLGAVLSAVGAVLEYRSTRSGTTARVTPGS